jgi:hypothetical protein
MLVHWNRCIRNANWMRRWETYIWTAVWITGMFLVLLVILSCNIYKVVQIWPWLFTHKSVPVIFEPPCTFLNFRSMLDLFSLNDAVTCWDYTLKFPVWSTGKLWNRNTLDRKRHCPWDTSNPTWTSLGSNPRPHCDRPPQWEPTF